MKSVTARLLAVASAAFFIASSALAQDAGTVTNNAFAIGSGPGATGFRSLLCGSAQLAVGQAAAAPICQTITGDVTISAGGVTAIGANKVTNAQLRQSGALSLIGRSANSAGNVADISATPASSCVFQETASTLTCAQIATANIANGAVTYGKMQNVAASRIVGNPTGSPAAPSEISLGATLSFSAAVLQTAAHTGDVTTAANSFATTIAANAVTYAKMQSVTASRLLGNPTGGAAVPSEITLGATLSFSGSALQTGAMTGDVTASANSFATSIAANAVTNAKLATMAANTIKANATGSTATPTDVAVPSCSGATNALIWTSGVGFGCNTIAGGGGSVSISAGNGISVSPNPITGTGSITNSGVVTVKQQVFTASGTYTPSTGMIYALIECMGAGGGGGGAAGTAGQRYIGGGGGGGGYSRVMVTAATIGASKTVTIGAGGAKGSAGFNSGSPGGDSCVTSSTCSSGQICTGKGGSGGGGSSNAGGIGIGGIGGVAGTGDFTPTGPNGFTGMYATIATVLILPGGGANTAWGGGASAATCATSAANGVAGTGFGSGGSGGCADNTASTATGGDGRLGAIIITEFNNQ